MYRLGYYRGDTSACWWYRCHMPLIHLMRNNQERLMCEENNAIISKDVERNGKFYQSHIGLYDIVVMQRQVSMDVFKQCEAMKKTGTKIVYEIDDDLFSIPKWNPSHDYFKQNKNNIRKFLNFVDAMFVSTRRLKEIYSKYCDNIYVLPNCIDDYVIFPRPKNGNKVGVLWQGSATHKNDMNIVMDSLKKIAKEDEVKLLLWSGFKRGTKIPVFKVPGAHTLQTVPFECFNTMFSAIDAEIGLAPISPIPFNKGKSNLKFLEYTMQDMVTVASNYGPYKETITHMENGMLCDKPSDWYGAVMYLVNNPDERERMVNNAKELVRKEYDITKQYKLWENAIFDVLGVENV